MAAAKVDSFSDETKAEFTKMFTDYEEASKLHNSLICNDIKDHCFFKIKCMIKDCAS